MKDKLLGKEQEILADRDNGMVTAALCEKYGVIPSSMRKFLNRHGRDTSRQIQSHVRQLDIKDAAYIAGILDGEGCITTRWLKSRGIPYVQSFITIGTSSQRLAEYLSSVTGVGSKGQYKRKGKDGWRPLHVWTLSSWQGADLLKQVLPYLQIKREQAELFIELTALKRQSKPGKRFAEDRQREIVEQFRKLNQRGQLENEI